MIKTKIVATLGPGCGSAETIKQMVDNGVDVFRLNFSHGTLEQHSRYLEQVNAVRAGHLHTIAVMGDLCGPKIRLGTLEEADWDLQAGSEVVIIAGLEQSEPGRLGTNYKNFSNDVKVGDRVLIDDGQIVMEAIDQAGDKTTCKVLVPGRLRSRKGINLPDSHVSAPSITEKDWQCVDWAIQNKLDFLALSFVRTADEILQLKEYIQKADSDIKLVAKIETPAALKNIDSIVDASDIILVARGDLGVEMDLAEVPLIQKRITNMCRRKGKPVIVATQMLQSMIDSPAPTRAEVSDIANAIMDFTDAVMLSGETAIGKYPIEAVKTIRKVAKVTEEYLDRSDTVYQRIDTADDLRLTAAVVHSVAQITEDIDAKLVVVWSESGSTARLLSKARIDCPILALSSNERICRRMCLHYGVIPRCRPIPADNEQFTKLVNSLILERHWAEPGDTILLVAGQPIGTAGATNAVIVHKITA
ncbi:MAG: pyruvate kinase [Sedimentisphaerales bacterium]|nr:pyruvate kinase [Sedimentisphaerales bacterium]